MDGFLARKLNAESAFGAKLDSVADMIMALILIIKIFPVVTPSTGILIWIIIIALIRLIAMSTAAIKYKTFASIHSYSNKFTGIVLFLFPLLILYIPANILMVITCLIATLSALEELLIQVTSKKLELNKKSLFSTVK